jgi:hypothetical protein
MATEVIRIDAKAYETLKKVAELSGQEMKSIVDEWLSQIQIILSEHNLQRLTFASKRYVSLQGKKQNLVVTYCTPLIFTTFELETNASEKTEKKETEKRLRKC